MEQKLRIDLQSADALRLSLQGEAPGTIRLQAPAAGTANYERLTHKPRINGVELVGDQSSEDLRIISENTVSGWAERTDYLPGAGKSACTPITPPWRMTRAIRSPCPASRSAMEMRTWLIFRLLVTMCDSRFSGSFVNTQAIP